LVHGYFTRRGASLHFQTEIEDPARHKMVAAEAVDGTVLFAMNDVARKLAPGARPFSTANQDAVAAWGHGEFERAVTIDPDFGTAWGYWVQQLGGSRKQVEAVAVARAGWPSLRSRWNARSSSCSRRPRRMWRGNAALAALPGCHPTTSLLSALARPRRRPRFPRPPVSIGKF
jgi:hypothetical protein